VNTNVSAGNPIYFNVCSEYPSCSNTINTFNLSVKIQTGSSSCSTPALTTTGTCTPITCTVNAPNTTTNGTAVNYTTTATALTCNPGFAGTPTYTCTGTTNPGTFTAGGTACSPIQCTIASANTTTNGTAVNYTTTATALTCNPGFAGTPTYTCTGTTNPGTFTAGGTACSQIQCTIASANTTTNGTAINYTTTATALTCNPGFAGTPTYTCTGTTNPGTFTAGGTACVASSNVFTPNWNAWTSIGCGSYISQSSNNMIEMIGPNGCGAQWSYFFTYLPAWATKVSFNWFYCTPDWGAQYDPGRFYVNNTWYDIITSGNGYGSCYSGTFTNFAVQGGTAFGPGVYSTDGSYGGPNLKLYDIVVQ
jgi:hypothetical protein